MGDMDIDETRSSYITLLMTTCKLGNQTRMLFSQILKIFEVGIRVFPIIAFKHISILIK